MRIRYRPLLQIQRDLLDIPRGMDRFRAYLRTILTPDGKDAELVPLAAANPMAKEHVTERLDALLAMNADALAEEAAEEAAQTLEDVHATFSAATVVLDDFGGGWTNRFDCEYGSRRPDPADRRYWITGCLWSSEQPSPRLVRETIRCAVYRTAHAVRNGPPRTLADLLRQEGYALAAAGCPTPRLDPDDLAYTREILAPHLPDTDKGSLIGCLFGDPAARSLGLTRYGLTLWAGLAVALVDGLKCRGGRDN